MRFSNNVVCATSKGSDQPSGQSFCWSLEYSMTIKLLTEHHLEFLSLKGNCTESTLVKTPHLFKWRFAGGSMMARLYWHLDPPPLIN